MKKTVLWLIVLTVLFAGAAAQAQPAGDTLCRRVVALLEDGDADIGYGGLCPGIGMDDGDAPAGLVTVTFYGDTGNIVVSYETDYYIWEHANGETCARTLTALCVRWAALTEGTGEELRITLRTGGQTAVNGLTFASAAEAYAYIADCCGLTTPIEW